MTETLEEKTFTADAKVMPKGQVTIPKEAREVLGFGNGDRVTFVVDHGKVIVVSSAVYAVQYLQDQLKGEEEKQGLTSEQDVNNRMKSIRDED